MKHVISFALLTLALLSNNSIAGFSQAPEINLPGTNGNVQLEDFKGKVIYLDFWASWCLPCKKSFPWMHEMKQKYAKQGFEVVAINLDEERKLADEFLKEADVNFTVATISAETWYHLFVTRTTGNSIRVWLNGTESSSGAQSGYGNFTIDTIGKADTIRYLNARVSQVRIFDSDESANVATYYDEGVDSGTPIPVLANYYNQMRR